MFTRPCYYRLSADESLWSQFFKNDDNRGKAAFQAMFFYQSTTVADEVSRYFLPSNSKNVFKVRGDSTSDSSDRDIRAEWLSINNTNFKGDFTISPKQRQGSVKFEVRYDLKKSFPDGFFSNFWVGVSAPLVFVENNLRFEQNSISNLGTTDAKDILTALDQSSWTYARFNQKETSRWGLPEVELKAGTVLLAKDSFYVGSTTSIILPFHKKQDPKYLFDPVVGFNKHIGLGSAISFQINLAEKGSESDVCFFLNAENVYLFPNTQYRTLDLKDKHWSRFLLLRKSGEATTIPGVNVLTQEVKVKAYNFADISGGFRLKSDSYQVEVGYSLFGHGDEKLSLKNTFSEIYGIASSASGSSASTSTISTLGSIDSTFTTIKEVDLDLTSGISKAGFTHQIHASLGYARKGRDTDIFCGVGAYIEIPHQNTCLHLWGIWAKGGASF